MIVAIVQARSGSTRLPKKVLKKVEGKPLLEHLLLRLKRAKTPDKIIVATTDQKDDDAVARIAKRQNIETYRGSENDVLDRYYWAAKNANADTIIRITGDCPLIDPHIVDNVVNYYKKNYPKFDYVCNALVPTFPDGMDVEVFLFDALQRAWNNARLASEREHVTPYIHNHPEQFRVYNLKYHLDYSWMRLTIDNPEDFLLIKKVFAHLYKRKKFFNLSDILVLEKHYPKLFLLNAHIKRNEGYAKSLKEDKIIKEHSLV